MDSPNNAAALQRKQAAASSLAAKLRVQQQEWQREQERQQQADLVLQQERQQEQQRQADLVRQHQQLQQSFMLSQLLPQASTVMESLQRLRLQPQPQVVPLAPPPTLPAAPQVVPLAPPPALPTATTTSTAAVAASAAPAPPATTTTEFQNLSQVLFGLGAAGPGQHQEQQQQQKSWLDNTSINLDTSGRSGASGTPPSASVAVPTLEQSFDPALVALQQQQRDAASSHVSTASAQDMEHQKGKNEGKMDSPSKPGPLKKQGKSPDSNAKKKKKTTSTTKKAKVKDTDHANTTSQSTTTTAATSTTTEKVAPPRWQTFRNERGQNEGKWTKAEKDAFREGFLAHGLKLAKLAALIPTRTPKQIKVYYAMYKRWTLQIVPGTEEGKEGKEGKEGEGFTTTTTTTTTAGSNNRKKETPATTEAAADGDTKLQKATPKKKSAEKKKKPATPASNQQNATAKKSPKKPAGAATTKASSTMTTLEQAPPGAVPSLGAEAAVKAVRKQRRNWTQQEENAFERGLKQFGLEFEKYTDIPTRTAKQIQHHHYQKYRNKKKTSIVGDGGVTTSASAGELVGVEGGVSSFGLEGGESSSSSSALVAMNVVDNINNNNNVCMISEAKQEITLEAAAADPLLPPPPPPTTTAAAAADTLSYGVKKKTTSPDIFRAASAADEREEAAAHTTAITSPPGADNNNNNNTDNDSLASAAATATTTTLMISDDSEKSSIAVDSCRTELTEEERDALMTLQQIKSYRAPEGEGGGLFDTDYYYHLGSSNNRNMEPTTTVDNNIINNNNHHSYYYNQEEEEEENDNVESSAAASTSVHSSSSSFVEEHSIEGLLHVARAAASVGDDDYSSETPHLVSAAAAGGDDGPADNPKRTVKKVASSISMNTGKWTEDEQLAFRMAYTVYGDDLKKFPPCIPTRTPRQIASYCNVFNRWKLVQEDVPERRNSHVHSDQRKKSFSSRETSPRRTSGRKPAIKQHSEATAGLTRRPWNEEEEAAFVGALRKYGADFEKFVPLVSSRTLQQIQNHYYYGRERYAALEETSSQSSSSESVVDLKEGKWSKDEEDVFVGALRKYGVDLEKCSRLVRTRSLQQVQNHYYYGRERYESLLADGYDEDSTGNDNDDEEEEEEVSSAESNVITEGRWTKEEVEALVRGLRKYGADLTKCSSFVPSRTLKQIENHYHYFRKRYDDLLAQGSEDEEEKDDDLSSSASIESTVLNEGRWSKEEVDALVRGLRKYGSDLTKCSRFVPSRTLKQIENHYYYCRQRYDDLLAQGSEDEQEKDDDLSSSASIESTVINEGRWSKEEVDALVRGLRKYGADFTKCSRFVPSRTIKHIENHYYYCRKRYDKLLAHSGGEESAASDSEEEDSSAIEGVSSRTSAKSHDTNEAKWSKEEKDAFRKAYAKHGNQLAKIAQIIPTKNLSQIKGYYAGFKRWNPASQGVSGGVAMSNNKTSSKRPRETTNRFQDVPPTTLHKRRRDAWTSEEEGTTKKERKSLTNSKPSFVLNEPVSIVSAVNEFLGLEEYTDVPVPGGFHTFFGNEAWRVLSGHSDYPRFRVVRDVARVVLAKVGEKGPAAVQRELEKLDLQREAKRSDFWDFFYVVAGNKGKRPVPIKRDNLESSLGDNRGAPRRRLNEDSVAATSLSPVSPAPIPLELPHTSSGIWKLDKNSRGVLLANFAGVEEISVEDKKHLCRMMQRDDVAVLPAGDLLKFKLKVADGSHGEGMEERNKSTNEKRSAVEKGPAAAAAAAVSALAADGHHAESSQEAIGGDRQLIAAAGSESRVMSVQRGVRNPIGGVTVVYESA